MTTAAETSSSAQIEPRFMDAKCRTRRQMLLLHLEACAPPTALTTHRFSTIGAGVGLALFGILVTGAQLASAGFIQGMGTAFRANAGQFLQEFCTTPWAITFATLGYIAFFGGFGLLNMGALAVGIFHGLTQPLERD